MGPGGDLLGLPDEGIRGMKFRRLLPIVLALATVATAKVDLATLPARDTVQLTIYNSADLTLTRERRALTVKEGANSLQFSWENTLIDPTSLQMLPKAYADQIDIASLVYPPRVQNLALWNISSEISAKVPVEISYLTSGLSWRAFYMGTLSQDETTMRLQGYVRVTNNSGEDYENAQVRLIVGQVHILDQIADLARRQYPYGRSGVATDEVFRSRTVRSSGRQEMEEAVVMYDRNLSLGIAKQKEVVKEGLSEYFLYTIEGTETIPTGWSKRLQSFDVDDIPVVNLYKYEEDRYGDNVIHFLSFTNDQEHELGETPIPDGTIKVYRGVDDEKHLSYEGQSSFKYIPVGDEVELNLGAVQDVAVKVTRMETRTSNYRFDNDGDISGWDLTDTCQVEVSNTRNTAVRVEVMRNFDTSAWDLTQTAPAGAYEKVDLDSVKFTLDLEPRSKQTFSYTITAYRGTRAADFAARQ